MGGFSAISDVGTGSGLVVCESKLASLSTWGEGVISSAVLESGTKVIVGERANSGSTLSGVGSISGFGAKTVAGIGANSGCAVSEVGLVSGFGAETVSGERANSGSSLSELSVVSGSATQVEIAV
jgi:hypothetical protein